VASKEGVEEAALDPPAAKLTPQKKVAILKTLTAPRRKLAEQGAGSQMLPPGCSISDPSYTQPVQVRVRVRACRQRRVS
jgi:hypothetical protein